ISTPALTGLPSRARVREGICGGAGARRAPGARAIRLTVAVRLRVCLVRNAMTSSAIAWPLFIAALTLAGTGADLLDLRAFFAIPHLPSGKDMEQCVEGIELRAEPLQFSPTILVEPLPGDEMFEVALQVEVQR